MKYKVVSDSASNIFSIPGQPYVTVPMKINIDREYVDEPGLDVRDMVEHLRRHKGPSGSSCPNVGEWLEAFGNAEVIFCLTISRNLSGSYNAAYNAAQAYMEEHPGRHVHILDSKSTGSIMAMYVDKLLELIGQKLDESAILEKFKDYQNHVHTLFCLESLDNLARNGRTSPALAKIAGVLGIRVIGEAQDGKIGMVAKPRGAKKAMEEMARLLLERGFKDGSLVRICHCYNPEAAEQLRDLLLSKHPGGRCIIEPTMALNSFYAEYKGMIVGIEGDFNKVNCNS